MQYKRSSRSRPEIRDNVLYEAVVVNHLDRRYMGGLEVEILNYTTSGDTPELTGQLKHVRYLSPFYGITPNTGLSPNDGYANTQKSYGMWAVPPDIGTRVLVCFAEGNANFGYWIGCIPDDYMNFMVPDPRSATERTTDSTPPSLTGAKLPVGEYNKLLETAELLDPTLFNKPYNKDFVGVLEAQGLLYDETRGTTTSSSRRETPSMVFGISTPGPLDKRTGSPKASVGPAGDKVRMPSNRLGGSSIVMDDGDDKLIRKTHAEDGPPFYVNAEAGELGGDETIPQNEGIRIRTRTGHQILLHNSEDLIYIGNSRGTAWIELTSDGKIDIHATDSISVMSGQDVNFTAERDFNVDAGRNVNIKASGRWADFQHFEDGKENGRVQIEALFNKNVIVGADYKIKIDGEADTTIGKDNNTSISGADHLTVKGNIYERTEGSKHSSSRLSQYRTSDLAIHDTATNSYFLSAKAIQNKATGGDSRSYINGNIETIVTGHRHESITGEVHLITESNHRTLVGADVSLTAATTIDTFAGGNINTTTQASSYLTASTNINQQAGGIIAGDASEIHWNSGLSGGASLGNDPTAAITALTAVKATAPEGAEAPNLLVTVPLPYVFPGAVGAVPYESILTRAPQHEPWTQHENMNPQGYKPQQTDRESPGILPLNDRIITPDTFIGGKTLDGQSKTVTGSSGAGQSSTFFDGGTGDGQITNNAQGRGTATTSTRGDFAVDTARGSGSGCNSFFIGDGALGEIKTKSGLTTMVAELFVPNFQGFIDDLEATGYQIKSLGGYCKRQTVSGSSWSVHASGGAIDINPPNPVMNNGPNGFFSPRPANAPITDMPSNTLELANKHGLGWGGAWSSIDDAMHFSAYKGEGGAYRFRKGYIPLGPSDEAAQQNQKPEDGEDLAEATVPAESEQNLPGAQNADGTANADGGDGDTGDARS